MSSYADDVQVFAYSREMTERAHFSELKEESFKDSSVKGRKLPSVVDC